jgi:hypothetical protein
MVQMTDMAVNKVKEILDSQEPKPRARRACSTRSTISAG